MLYTGRLYKRAFRIIPGNIIDFFIFQLSAMENVGASTLTVKSTIPLRPVLPLHNNKKNIVLKLIGSVITICVTKSDHYLNDS